MFGRLWQFLLAHPVPGVGLVLGPLISVVSLVMDAWHLYELGLPASVWAAIGLGVFCLSVIGILFRWYEQNILPAAPALGTLRGEATAPEPRKPPRHDAPFILSGLVVLVLIVVGYDLYDRHRGTSPPAPISLCQPTPPASPVPRETVAPSRATKVYSEAEKEDLRNALREVSKILDGQCADVVQKINDIFGAWSDLTNVPQTGNAPWTGIVPALEQKLDSLAEAIITLRVAVRDYTGPMQAYRSYSDDISPILNLSWQSNSPNPMDTLAQSVSRLRLNVSVLDRVAQYHDKTLLSAVTGLDFGLSDLQANRGNYLNWLQQTKSRIASFRTSIR